MLILQAKAKIIYIMKENNSNDKKDQNLLTDISYMCSSTKLIVDSLEKGSDIAQLPNGDIIITETKIVNTQYTWDKGKNRMVKLTQI